MPYLRYVRMLPSLCALSIILLLGASLTKACDQRLVIVDNDFAGPPDTLSDLRCALMFLENSQTPFDAARKTRAGRADIGAFTSCVGFRARRDGLELRQMRTPGRLGPVFYIACQPASRALCCGFARKFTKPTSQPLTVRRMSTLHSSNQRGLPCSKTCTMPKT